MPLADPETQNGFYLNIANQPAICSIGIVAVPVIELITCFMVNNISVAAAVIENSLLEFASLIEKNHQLSADRKSKFRNIIVKIMDFDA